MRTLVKWPYQCFWDCMPILHDSVPVCVCRISVIAQENTAFHICMTENDEKTSVSVRWKEVCPYSFVELLQCGRLQWVVASRGLHPMQRSMYRLIRDRTNQLRKDPFVEKGINFLNAQVNVPNITFVVRFNVQRRHCVRKCLKITFVWSQRCKFRPIHLPCSFIGIRWSVHFGGLAEVSFEVKWGSLIHWCFKNHSETWFASNKFFSTSIELLQWAQCLCKKFIFVSFVDHKFSGGLFFLPGVMWNLPVVLNRCTVWRGSVFTWEANHFESQRLKFNKNIDRCCYSPFRVIYKQTSIFSIKVLKFCHWAQFPVIKQCSGECRWRLSVRQVGRTCCWEATVENHSPCNGPRPVK